MSLRTPPIRPRARWFGMLPAADRLGEILIGMGAPLPELPAAPGGFSPGAEASAAVAPVAARARSARPAVRWLE